MNFSVPAGFLLAAGVVVYLLADGVANPWVVLSKHAFVCVVGGTLAAAFICCRFSFLFQMGKVFLLTVSGKRRDQLFVALREIIAYAELLNEGGKIRDRLEQTQTPFLKELLKLSEEAGLENDEFDEVVEKRLEQQNERYKRDAYLFKTIGKFPPAFGLIGTSVGMIALLQGLGAEDAFQRIGPAMSIALVATFYGLVIANFLLIPIGEHLHLAAEDDLTMRRIVADGVRLLREGRHPLLVQEYLISYLPPAERGKVTNEVTGGSARAKAA
jgi:chemotaxis protein MotA